jgi:hypothetical protein
MGIGCVDAFVVSRFQDSDGRRTFSLAGRFGVSRRLHDSGSREYRVKQRDVNSRDEIDPREFSPTRPAGRAGPDGRHGKLPSPFRWKRSGETGSREISSDQAKFPEARSGRRDVVLSGGSNCRFETGHSKAADCSGGRFYSGARFSVGANSIFSFAGICASGLAERQRHTPRNTSASRLEITPRRLPWWTADGTGQRSTKTTFGISKEKIHEEDQGNCVDGSNRARLCRSGEGGERSML